MNSGEKSDFIVMLIKQVAQILAALKSRSNPTEEDHKAILHTLSDLLGVDHDLVINLPPTTLVHIMQYRTAEQLVAAALIMREAGGNYSLAAEALMSQTEQKVGKEKLRALIESFSQDEDLFISLDGRGQ